MYNLLYSLGIAVVLYVLTSLVADDWVAGILPALLGLGVGYFVLARRTFKKFEKIATSAVAELQTVQSDPAALERAKTKLKSALPLAKWQFLIEQQIHGQLGQLCYMGDTMRQRRDHAEARGHLEKAWSRDWTSQLTLAVIEYKAGDKDQALKRMGDAKSSGSDQVIYWGVWAWMAHERKQTDTALQVLADAIKKHEKAEALIGMRDAIANKRTVDVTLFGQTWFQFFPEHFQKLPPAKQMELMGANAPEMNRAQRRAMKRGKGGMQQPANGPMRPHPRR